MLKRIDDFLSGITMYRLVLYVLLFLLACAAILSGLKLIPFNPVNLLATAIFLVIVCWITNKLFAKVLKVPTNLESVYITALILTFLVQPYSLYSDFTSLGLIAIFSQASKYLLTIKRQHVFNPAAFGVFISAIVLNYSASWWIGNQWMIVPVMISGLLIVRKVQRFSLVISFILTVLVMLLSVNISKGNDIFSTLSGIILNTPLFYFAYVMLTEPQTTPSKKILQIFYGIFAGLLYSLPFNLGPVAISAEMALVLGNFLFFILSPREKVLTVLKEKIKTSADIYDFVFKPDEKLSYLPGQYLEWTLSHKSPDSRGVRRYFTIASSPTEENLRIGVKFYPEGSSFKKTLMSLKEGDRLLVGQLSGEFTLPKNQSQKLCFIAGGIGVTPYRSMIKNLSDSGEKRDIVLLYSVKKVDEFVYKEIFENAFKAGVKPFYVLSDKENTPKNWKGYTGYIDTSFIQKHVPDFKERIFYISGPHSMVDAFEKSLKAIGVETQHIKIDFFPGYA